MRKRTGTDLGAGHEGHHDSSDMEPVGWVCGSLDESRWRCSGTSSDSGGGWQENEKELECLRMDVESYLVQMLFSP